MHDGEMGNRCHVYNYVDVDDPFIMLFLFAFKTLIKAGCSTACQINIGVTENIDKLKKSAILLI